MIKGIYTITENTLIAPRTFKLVLGGEGVVEGEFVNIGIPGYYLRRPLSVCDKEDGQSRRIFRLPEAPQDYVEVDLDTPFTIRSEEFASMGKATPFEGWEVYGKVCRTVYRGKMVFSI